MHRSLLEFALAWLAAALATPADTAPRGHHPWCDWRVRCAWEAQRWLVADAAAVRVGPTRESDWPHEAARRES